MSLPSVVRVGALVITVAALAGCGTTTGAPQPAPAAAPPVVTAAAPSAPSGVRVAKLPAAPPVETWVKRGNDFQQTLDLQMQTELIKLGVPTSEATVDAARAFAYFVCSGLRAKRATLPDLVTEAYPSASNEIGRTAGLGINANSYCLDVF